MSLRRKKKQLVAAAMAALMSVSAGVPAIVAAAPIVLADTVNPDVQATPAYYLHAWNWGYGKLLQESKFPQVGIFLLLNRLLFLHHKMGQILQGLINKHLKTVLV